MYIIAYRIAMSASTKRPIATDSNLGQGPASNGITAAHGKVRHRFAVPVERVRIRPGVEERLDRGGPPTLRGRVERAPTVRQAGFDVHAMLDQDRDTAGVAGTRRGMRIESADCARSRTSSAAFRSSALMTGSAPSAALLPWSFSRIRPCMLSDGCLVPCVQGVSPMPGDWTWPTWPTML